MPSFIKNCSSSSENPVLIHASRAAMKLLTCNLNTKAALKSVFRFHFNDFILRVENSTFGAKNLKNRGFFTLGKADSESEKIKSGYFVKNVCTGCGKCYSACPQKCISFAKHESETENNAGRTEKSRKPGKAVIDQNRCLHCGRCVPVCPVKAIIKPA